MSVYLLMYLERPTTLLSQIFVLSVALCLRRHFIASKIMIMLVPFGIGWPFIRFLIFLGKNYPPAYIRMVLGKMLICFWQACGLFGEPITL